MAIRAGALWVAGNTDSTYPSPRGPLPGNGAMVAALAHATGRQPVVVGKPEPELHQASVDRVGARRHPPAGLTTDDLRLNDVLRRTTEAVPEELGISQVIRWGTRFGTAPEAYWRAFREVALDLWMQRSSAEHYQMAARPQRPKRPGDQKP